MLDFKAQCEIKVSQRVSFFFNQSYSVLVVSVVVVVMMVMGETCMYVKLGSDGDDDDGGRYM